MDGCQHTHGAHAPVAEAEVKPRIAKAKPSQRRFDRLVRLVSETGFAAIEQAHVVVFGLGGVGGFAAEGLARCGVGRLTLVDFDVVCATNVNRQIQALATTVGSSKAELLAERVRAINPLAQVRAVQRFYTAQTADELLPLDDPDGRPDFVVDAIDNVSAKLHLLHRCREHGIPLVSSMGAAGKLDPTAVRVADLYETHSDPLARTLRKQLRQKYAWPDNADRRRPVKSGVLVVYSEESRRLPLPPGWDRDHGFQCICPTSDNDFHTCSSRNVIEGSAVFVTSVFGMTAASVVVRALAAEHVAPTAIELAAHRQGHGQGHAESGAHTHEACCEHDAA